jgi:hypothetical protein
MPDFAIERRCEGVVCGIDEAALACGAASLCWPRLRLPAERRGDADGDK